MKKAKKQYATIIMTLSSLLTVSLLRLSPAIYAQEGKALPGKGQNIAPDSIKELKQSTIKESAESTKGQDNTPTPETPIENIIAVTTEQLVNKPENYLNKNVKFTAPFFAFSNLALDYKPAFRSSRTYLSFLLLRSNGHTPFSEIKLAMLVPKEKDPLTKMLQTLKEGDVIEITGRVFACSLDEPWLDVLRLKKIASTKKVDNTDDKAADDKESSTEDSPAEK